MKTYPIEDEAGRLFAVEVDVAYCSVHGLARTIAATEGVTDTMVCKPFSGQGDVRARFRFQGEEFAVVEPFGDNSRYWIGPVSDTARWDISPIEAQLKSYVPPLFRRVLGSLVTLNLSALTRR